MTIHNLTFSSTLLLDPETATVSVASTGNDKKSGEFKLWKFKVILGFQQFKGLI